MTKRSTDDRDRIVRALLERHGRTYAEEVGIKRLQHGDAPALFQLLCASILFSARIGSTVSTAAARGLLAAGWTTPEKLARSSWEDRVAVLHEAGYTRYQERTATMLGECAELALARYDGDLRKLRARADRDPRRERRLVQEFKGIGEAGADIFLREAQVTWPELRPYLDSRALAAARRLGLGTRPDALADLVGPKDIARLVAALVRVELQDDYAAVTAPAA